MASSLQQVSHASNEQGCRWSQLLTTWTVGAAASLKYAKPQDLPSFPIVGIEKGNSGFSAANLAHANQKPFEHWKPGRIDDSHQAAMLAKDYKMDPLWQPSSSAAGSKAAMLAHQGPGRDWWQPSATKDGGSAAAIAFKSGKGLSPQPYTGVGDQAKKNALLAATSSIKGRQRSGSTPTPAALYPDQENAQKNALGAATFSSRANEASRITHLSKNITPKMFTEHPPIAYEDEDRKHEASLQASAIAMAQKMYAAQEVDDDGNIHLNTEAARAANRQSTSTDNSLQAQALQYLSLQDAAQKLAAERLAKIQNPDETAAFRDYYGYPTQTQQKRQSRMSVRGSRNLGRASSAEPTSMDYDSDDEERATRIRGRQAQLNRQVQEVDQKQAADRKNLLAAAEARVHARMTALDQDVYDKTGRMSQAMVEQWDAKARAKAAANSELRQQNHGKVDIGGGKWMDQSAIEAIAAARIKPTLDDINEKAADQRARDETARLEEEQRRRQVSNEKAREAETKAEQKRIAGMSTQSRYAFSAMLTYVSLAQEKAESKARKEEEKRAAKEEKTREKELAKEEKRRSKDVKALAASGAAAASAAEHRPTSTEIRPTTAETTTTTTTRDVPVAVIPTAVSAPAPVTPVTTTRPDTTRLESDDVFAHEGHDESDYRTPVVLPTIGSTGPRQSVAASRASKETTTTPSTTMEPTSPTSKRQSSGLKGLLSKFKRTPHGVKESNTSEFGGKHAAEARAGGIAAAGGPAAGHDAAADARHQGRDVAGDVSSLESDDDDLYAEPSSEPVVERGRTRSRASLSTNEYEEARDTLAPPVQPANLSSKHGESPNRESKFHEEV